MYICCKISQKIAGDVHFRTAPQTPGKEIEKHAIVNATYVPNHTEKLLVSISSSLLNYEEGAPATQIHACEFGKEYAYDELSGHNKICGGTCVGVGVVGLFCLLFLFVFDRFDLFDLFDLCVNHHHHLIQPPLQISHP